MNRMLTSVCLRKENLAYANSGGVSTGNCTAGFIPAFRDSATGRVEPSRLPDGTLAPMHLLAGLPREWVVARDNGNGVLAIKATVVAGFLHAGLFYTREQAARAVAPRHLTTSEWRKGINAGYAFQTSWSHWRPALIGKMRQRWRSKRHRLESH